MPRGFYLNKGIFPEKIYSHEITILPSDILCPFSRHKYGIRQKC